MKFLSISATKSFVAFCSAFLVSAGLFAQGGAVSLESLLREMANRDALASWPEVPYTTGQASSYDRNSKTNNPEDGADAQSRWGKGWFANKDFSHYIRTEDNNGRREDVMLDVKGPGAIVRFWNTLGGNAYKYGGIIRVYIDGNPTPAIEMHNKNLLGSDGLVGEPFSYMAPKEAENPVWRGRNLFLPIPYQKSCKVTFDGHGKYAHQKGWSAMYYALNYRTYPAGTRVESFTMEALNQARELVKETGERLTKYGAPRGEKLAASVKDHTLAPGKYYRARLKGSSAVKELAVKIKADNMEQALRSTVLEISFDGEKTVWCPLGQFFGTGYQIKPHSTFNVAMDSAGLMTARWTMPFRKKADLRVRNYGDQPVILEKVEVRTDDWEWNENSMYFCASWKELRSIKTDYRRDGNYVEVKGKGVLVGDNLTLFNTHPDWWGEGDEKIYVDGETFPSHFGTGTEDYYGYAWCRPQFFSYPFHSQPTGAGNKAVGITSNNRYRGLDAVPFTSSLKFDMEIWHPFEKPMTYSPACFWYARPGAERNVQPDPEGVKLPVTMKKEDVINSL
ncbi:hypothetical protein FUAX_25990 [Fulvitalea axinellae]|uniref:DUF2961 domain-containing protein n=1 Tax=Fulvitalea axinellae TaxID=1182444 RepID=A0AAU9CQC8_9BACT|nr:hypothetical protein FUAX_25990 [Fulvitalea axinellae]